MIRVRARPRGGRKPKRRFPLLKLVGGVIVGAAFVVLGLLQKKSVVRGLSQKQPASELSERIQRGHPGDHSLVQPESQSGAAPHSNVQLGDLTCPQDIRLKLPISKSTIPVSW
jgi:hypothetical protein